MLTMEPTPFHRTATDWFFRISSTCNYDFWR